MPRSDKKNHTCACCGYTFTRPEKLRKHYKSKKNQCNISITRTQVSKQVLLLTFKSGSNSATQIFFSQNEVQEEVKDQVVVQDSEAGPGPATQTYREEQTNFQSNINQKKYALENHFRSIYEVEDGIIEKEPPTKNIEFLERRPDPNKGHQNLNSMMV